MKFTLRGKRIQEGWGKRELALQLFTRESSSLPGGFIPVYWRTRGSDVEFPWREWQLRRCNREGDDFDKTRRNRKVFQQRWMEIEDGVYSSKRDDMRGISGGPLIWKKFAGARRYTE